MEFSIVIPHKNSPDQLARMLRSIPQRDDCEIIIVDDASDPATADFEKFPGTERSDCRVIFNPRGFGAGFARNVGIDRAKGTWLLFADADDYFTPRLADLLDAYNGRCDTDMVIFDADCVDDNGHRLSLSLNRYIAAHRRGKQYAADVLRFGFWAPWSRLIRRDLLLDNNIRFRHLATANDLMAIVLAGCAARNIEVFHERVYTYCKYSNGSHTEKAYDHRTYLQRLEQKLQLNRIYRREGYPYLWPIVREFNDRKINASPEAREIKKRYNYSMTEDLRIYARYILGKLRRHI